MEYHFLIIILILKQWILFLLLRRRLFICDELERVYCRNTKLWKVMQFNRQNSILILFKIMSIIPSQITFNRIDFPLTYETDLNHINMQKCIIMEQNRIRKEPYDQKILTGEVRYYNEEAPIVLLSEIFDLIINGCNAYFLVTQNIVLLETLFS